MKILDTTLRDGSYAVDFKFSCKNVKDLVSKSARIGIEYIEIGHGQGLNASSLEHGIALQTDEEYMNAARSAAPHSKLGFFCIPGIARLEDIHTAKSNDMNFIRIGCNAKNIQDALPYVEKCISEGLEPFVNFMKTYTATPGELAHSVKLVSEHGAKCVYIVDSAGYMTKNVIKEYYDAVREIPDIEIGFHGHNNLGLALENTIFCIEKGFDFVDCSYQGLGRSLGNASLEQVIMVLERNGISTGYDIPKVLEYGFSGLKNVLQDKLVNPLDYVCGYAGFHSSYLKDIYRCCEEKEVDSLRLIIAYSKINRETMDYKELCSVADQLQKDPEDNPYNFGIYFTERFSD